MHLAKASSSTWGAEAPPGPRLCTSGAWWVLVWAAAGPWAAAATPGAPMLLGCSCCRPRWLRQGQPLGPSHATALHPPRSPVATPQASRAAALHGPDLWSRICAATAAESAQPWVRAGQPQAGGRQRCLHQQLLARQAEQAEGLWRLPRAVVGAPGSPWARAVLSQPWGRSQQHPVRPRSGARQPLAWGCPARDSPGRGRVVTLPLLSMGSGDGA